MQIRHDAVSFIQPTRFGSVGLGGVYLSQGEMEGRDASGRPSSGFIASDAAVQVAVSGKLSGDARLGLGIKYLRSTLANASAQTFALDLGGQYDLSLLGPGRPSLGLAVQNIGPGMKFLDQVDPLPLAVAAGVGYRLPMGLTLALDFKERPHSGKSEFCVGSEYAMLPAFSVRAGYTRSSGNGEGASRIGSGSLSATAGLAAGFGIKAYGYTLDYSMTPFGELGNVQRFSLGTRF